MNATSSYWSFFAEHRAEILSATAEHLMLVVIAMLIAMAIAVPLGMFIVERPALPGLDCYNARRPARSAIVSTSSPGSAGFELCF